MSLLLLFGPLLAACTPADDANWRVETLEQVTSETEGEDDWEEDDEEVFYGKWLFAEIWDDGAETGFYWADEEIHERCILLYEVESMTPTDGCTECAVAYELLRGDAEAYIDIDDSCESEGWTGLEGTTIGFGVSEEWAYVDFGDGWQAWPEGEAEGSDEGLFVALWLGE